MKKIMIFALFLAIFIAGCNKQEEITTTTSIETTVSTIEATTTIPTILIACDPKAMRQDLTSKEWYCDERLNRILKYGDAGDDESTTTIKKVATSTTIEPVTTIETTSTTIVEPTTTILEITTTSVEASQSLGNQNNERVMI